MFICRTILFGGRNFHFDFVLSGRLGTMRTAIPGALQILLSNGTFLLQRKRIEKYRQVQGAAYGNLQVSVLSRERSAGIVCYEEFKLFQCKSSLRLKVTLAKIVLMRFHSDQ